MADKPTKPKRDLRARLGRTITPKTQGAGGPTPPPTVGGASETPAPAVKPPGGVTPPPGGVAAPPAGIGGTPFGSSPDVAPPPFGQPAAPEASAPAQAAPQQQVVRLEFDDKLVTDQEVGKGTKMRTIIVSAVVLVAGMGIGWGVGRMLAKRAIFNRTVADAQDIYSSVNEASSDRHRAQTHINAIVEAAVGDETEGTAPSIAYDRIEALRASRSPSTRPRSRPRTTTRSRPRSSPTSSPTCGTSTRIWLDVRQLAAESLAQNRRAELEQAVEAAGEGQTNFGAVLHRNDEGHLIGSLGFVSIEQDDDGTPHVRVRATRGGAPRELQVYEANEQELDSTAAFVLDIDGASSRGVLAEQTGSFGLFLQHVAQPEDAPRPDGGGPGSPDHGHQPGAHRRGCEHQRRLTGITRSFPDARAAFWSGRLRAVAHADWSGGAFGVSV